MRRLRVYLMSLACAFAVKTPAQSPQTIPTFPLESVATHAVAVPPFRFMGQPQCDGSGNVYYIVVQNDSSPRTIVRISEDGEEGQPFLLPNDADERHSWKLYPASDGTVFVLSSFYPTDKRPETHTLIKLSSSGEVISRTTLPLPPPFQVLSFAVQPNGSSMVIGSIFLQKTSDANPDPPDNLYTAWLDPAGRIIRQVGLDPAEKKDIWLSEPNSIAVTVGSPGTFLSISGDKVKVYDTSGSLQYSVPARKPAKDAFLFSVGYVDGQIAIPWSSLAATVPSTDATNPAPRLPPHHAPQGKLDLTWLLMDVQDGHSHGFFKMPRDYNGMALCYLGAQRFLYQTGKDGRLIYVEAHPR
jgi:hypothetical protein